MPVQHFSTDAMSDPVVTISWDFSYSEIDIAYRGQSLATITDPTPLRTTGMHGATPDGSQLVVHLRADTFDGRFEVSLDGRMLIGAPVLVAASAPASSTRASRYEPLPGWQQYGNVGGVRGIVGVGPTADQAKRMKSGRTWLKVQGVLTLLLAVVVWSIVNSDSSSVEDPEVLKLTAVIMGGLGVLYLVFSAVAKGRQAKTVFGVAMAISALNLLAGIGQIVNGAGSSTGGIIVSAFAARAYYSAMKAAGEVRWSAAPQQS